MVWPLPPSDQINDIAKYGGLLIGGLLALGLFVYYLSTIMD
jgi:hypothetical protein